MRRYYPLAMLLLFGCIIQARAQDRTHIADFSLHQQYFNPALTGYSGSAIKTLYRDEWSANDEAPLSAYLSAELNLSDLNDAVREQEVQHAFGLSGLYDTYGFSTKKGFGLSYSASYPITDLLRIRAGATLAYTNRMIDHGELIMGDQNDPAFASLRDHNKTNQYGVNFGVALTAEDFYVGYSAGNLLHTENTKADDNPLYLKPAIQHIVQAGYRRMVAEPLGLIVNGMYRYDKNREGVFDAQLKAVLYNKLWVGGGYRQDLAYTVTGGIRVNQFKLGYTREIPSEKVSNAYRGMHEITLSYNLTPIFSGRKGLIMW